MSGSLIEKLAEISVRVFTIGRAIGDKDLEELSAELNSLSANIAQRDWHKETPTHGRCIDADLLCKRLIEAVHTQDAEWLEKYKGFIFDVVIPIIVGCPTVIEASTESTEERE